MHIKNRIKAGRQLFRDYMRSLLQCDVEKNLLAMDMQSKQRDQTETHIYIYPVT